MSQPHENYTPTQLALIDRIDIAVTRAAGNFFGASEIGIVLVSWFLPVGWAVMRAYGA